MTKIDTFMYDIATLIYKWEHDYPCINRDTQAYYNKIIEYMKKYIRENKEDENPERKKTNI